MNPVVAKVLKKTLTTSATVVGALFVVYFWNLDQKLMGWLRAVARPAPAVPMPSPKMNSGSRTILRTAPVVMPIIEQKVLP